MSRAIPRRWSRLVTLVVLAAVAGCETTPATLTVTGTASYDGQPISNGIIYFGPVDGGSVFSGPIASGRFKLDGVSPGKKKVKIIARKESAGSSTNVEDFLPSEVAGNDQIVTVGAASKSFDFKIGNSQ